MGKTAELAEGTFAVVTSAGTSGCAEGISGSQAGTRWRPGVKSGQLGGGRRGSGAGIGKQSRRPQGWVGRLGPVWPTAMSGQAVA